jgi:fimbrial isopeptide formation D2 family protein
VIWGTFAALAIAALPVQTFAQTCGSPGKDGPGGTLSGVVNTYFPGTGTANAGTNSVSVGASNIFGAATSIAIGDLLLIIQTQDASINSGNTSSYGDGNSGVPASGVTNLNSAGRFEFAVATNAISTAGGTITLKAALTYSYNRAAATSTKGQSTFQVIRVPQYSSATLSSGLTAAAWDGTSGGVLVIDVAGNLTAGGTVSVDALGFRGGGAQQWSGGSGANTDYRTLASNTTNGSKGEGIAGTPRWVYDGSSVNDTGVDGYPNGSMARGAPGNAGGGGTDGDPANNDENTGGGGGGNGGAGGIGGNSWNSNVVAGGYGGAAVAAAVNRMVLGGGGGAGSRNNSSGSESSGGRGGGMVIIRAGTVSGSGTISANGAPGVGAQNDGGGGGGAGGSIMVVANSGAITAFTLRANGGKGGDAWPTQAANGTPGERHGPGGGGGGGFIAYTSSTTSSITGGANGITTTSSDSYGSAAGSAGATLTITATNVPGSGSGAQCVPVLTVTKTTSTPAVNSGASATYTITTANAANTSDAQNLAVSDVLPGGFAYASTVSVTLSGGATRPTTTNPSVGATTPAFSEFNIPAGGSVAIAFTVSIPATASGTFQNPATATYLDPKRTTTSGTTTASYNSASSTGEDVTVTGIPNVSLVKSVSPSGTQLPGTDLVYGIAFSNGGATVARSLVIKDAIPSFTDFKIGSVTSSLGTTGLTVAVAYSNNGGTTFVYTPVSGGGGASAGYDRNVTNIRWTFTNNLSQTSPNNAGSVGFTVKIR